MASSNSRPPTRSSFVLKGKDSKSALLNVLSEVKSRIQDKLGIVDFPMPQFIMIGSQSVGKSRLVESIAGEQFNFVSGTLGSRRPTILEFRNVAAAKESKWYVMNDENKYIQHSMPEVMAKVGQAHESLGHNVTKTPINVRVESALCPDMQIVDLPGYRGYSANEEAKALAAKIVDLNKSFLEDPRNTILCVEEAGDAANMSSLDRVRQVDPGFNRTILIRNKLDKYYGDLTAVTVDKWLKGMGDLPEDLTKFALTLPHWQDGSNPPKRLDELRSDMNKQDMGKMNELGASSVMKATVGWDNFATYVEKKTEEMFVAAIGPVLQKLKDLLGQMQSLQDSMAQELDGLDETKMLSTIRMAGMTFAQCLNFIMEGYIESEQERMSMAEELTRFIDYHKGNRTQKANINEGRHASGFEFPDLPNSEFSNLSDYIDFLKNSPETGKAHFLIPGFDLQINGGAQYRRLLVEVECFLRFSEMDQELKKRQVMQGLGVSLGSITWREVVVKLLNHLAHLPLQRSVMYAGERIKWFFMMQKEPIIDFMNKLEGSPDQKLHSKLHMQNGKLLKENEAIKRLVFDTYDRVCQRQLTQFLELFKNTLHATFSNPWASLGGSTATKEIFDDGAAGDDAGVFTLPDFDETCRRVKDEITCRTGKERTIMKWLYDIPVEPEHIETAVDKVQILAIKVYEGIRSQICDQVELFTESFFKMPLMRRLEEEMMKIELNDAEKRAQAARREQIKSDQIANDHSLKEVQECYKILSDFTVHHRAATPLPQLNEAA